MKRDYLGTLIRAVGTADPSVVALDFILRSPSPDNAPNDHPEHRLENDAFVQSVDDVSSSSAVVLPRTLFKHDDGTWTSDSAIYDAYKLKADGIYQGYINLPDDGRRVAFVQLTPADGRVTDSFAQAIVRADHLPLPSSRVARELPFGRFLELDKFTHVLAEDVLRKDPSTLDRLRHKIVLIGGDRHQDGWHRGERIDMHDAPSGKMLGVVLHANYVGSILQSHLYWSWGESSLKIVDFMLALVTCLYLLFILIGLSEACFCYS